MRNRLKAKGLNESDGKDSEATVRGLERNGTGIEIGESGAGES